MPFNPKRTVERFLKKNPDVYTIVVTGAYGRKSAIRALGLILGQVATVTMGVNPKIIPDVAIFDYKSSADFPDFEPDVVVVTSCRNDEQAERFFGLANKAGAVFVNFNDVAQHFATHLKNPEVTTYGDELPAHYYFENHDFSLEGYEGDFVNPEREHIPAKIRILGEHNIRPITMAVAVAKYFGMDRKDILKGVADITPLHGRMSPARGLHGSIIIDDSSYISVDAVHNGIKTIEQLESSAKMVITDNAQKVNALDMGLLTDVVILGEKPKGEPEHPKVHYFDNELDLIHYVGTRLEPDGIVLLEIPLPEIIQSYLW